jgi:hypothetical protein
MQMRDLLNPDICLRMAYKGFAAIVFALLAVRLVTRVLPVLGPLLVVGAIAYALYRRSTGEKRSSGERRNTAGAERTPIMPQGRGGA